MAEANGQIVMNDEKLAFRKANLEGGCQVQNRTGMIS